MPGQIWLIRHGETEWSRSGAHTGRTDIPLTDAGRRKAVGVGEFLRHRSFSVILCSPLVRALETSRLAGYGTAARIDPNLSEWDYGAYEGRTTDEIRRDSPGWSIWNSPLPGGETIEQVASRAQAVIDCVLRENGDAALFAHGHILRILAACWLGLPPQRGQLFVLDTASVSTLGYEREARAIVRWNVTPNEQDRTFT